MIIINNFFATKLSQHAFVYSLDIYHEGGNTLFMSNSNYIKIQIFINKSNILESLSLSFSQEQVNLPLLWKTVSQHVRGSGKCMHFTVTREDSSGALLMLGTGFLF
uniref:Uncharacterized protein n=1 Tax=Octopus bimaculoides TaxID=37653 RepID=A0A0L8G635_OCTBM